ncbi:MAG: tRNA (N(6)-L-threonylcarbamoyladenosine(37)-C(2))-methylthiotransferase MtaB [Acidobacteria bacterium]|nr:tRNA (N(6)-L-threonylcarbamoyladenosine(37)-C(2))-methylthiotransferase MtaB [Acidobacteriota bacterium]
MSSYYVHSFGCRATQADSAVLDRQLLERGMEPAESAAAADLVVLNTCTVTAEADKDARAKIRRIHRENPECRILVTGCYAQRAPEELASMPGVAWVVGNSHKQQVADIALQGCGPVGSSTSFVHLRTLAGTASNRVFVDDIFAHTELMAAPVFDGAGYEKTRPNLKVQDGCDNRCSFCVIPFVRGQSRSLKLGDVVREMNALVTAGYREVVISGINLGRWGRDFSARRCFEDLVRAFLSETGVERLRLSSIEPMDWSDELIELCASSPRIAKHAHIPLQSGSDRILRLMHRKYRPWHYEQRVLKIRNAMADAAIGADVMVGFPGETDGDFEENRAFIRALPFTYLHVFTYSPRSSTPAAAMRHQVPAEVKRERNRILRELAAQKKQCFQEMFVGRKLSTITLDVRKNGHTETLTDNYQKLWLRGEHPPNQIVDAMVEAAEHGEMRGTIDTASQRAKAAPEPQ